MYEYAKKQSNDNANKRTNRNCCNNLDDENDFIAFAIKVCQVCL